MEQHVQRDEIIRGLDYIAGRFNALGESPGDLRQIEKEAWAEVRDIVTDAGFEGQPSRWTKLKGEDAPTSLDWVAGRFNEFARKAPIFLEVSRRYSNKGRGKQKRTSVSLAPSVPSMIWSDTDPYRAATILLWHCYFQPDGYWRLKTCRKCSRWFVDKGKYRTSYFCSRSCADTWWTRERRRLGKNAYEIESTIHGIEGIQRVLKYRESKSAQDERDLAITRSYEMSLTRMTRRLKELQGKRSPR